MYPQAGCNPKDYLELAFDRFFLQPMDGQNHDKNIAAAYEYCEQNPPWELSIQKQKLVGIR